jgi:acyl carrier protein
MGLPHDETNFGIGTLVHPTSPPGRALMSHAEEYVTSTDQEQLGSAHVSLDRLVAVVQTILRRKSIAGSILLDDDLLKAGFTSLDMVDLILALEAEFSLKIPDGQMTVRNFRSISAIRSLVTSLAQTTL